MAIFTIFRQCGAGADAEKNGCHSISLNELQGSEINCATLHTSIVYCIGILSI